MSCLEFLGIHCKCFFKGTAVTVILRAMPDLQWDPIQFFECT